MPSPPEARSLVLLSGAERALSEASGLEDLKLVRDQAAAVAQYTRAQGLSLELRRHAVTIQAVAQRRIGELSPREVGGRGNKASSLDDGLSRDQRYKARQLADQTEGEEEVRALVASMRDPSLARLQRVVRDEAAARRAAERPDVVASAPDAADLRLGDFREVLLDVPDASVDLILTDPPYPREYLSLWSDLAELAARVLKPGGVLAAMSGQSWLPEVYARLSEYLDYRWTIAYLIAGPATVVHRRGVSSQWKPVLVYGTGATPRFHDVIRSDGEPVAALRAEPGQSETTGWAQTLSGTSALLRQLAAPGSLVLDPFLGTGTTAVAALAYGCRVIGAELDEVVHQAAVARVSS